MKKTLLITLAASALTASGFAQGTISFQASLANGYVNYGTDGQTFAQVPVAGAGIYGLAHIGFFAAPNGTVLTVDSSGMPVFGAAWSAASAVESIAIGAGKTAAASFSLPGSAGAPGANVELEVVGWTGSATSWADAVAAGGTTLLGFSGMTYGGVTYGALGWSQPTGNPTTTPAGTPAATITGANGYHGLVLTQTPEPSTIVLGGLGAAALLAFRRRK